VGVVGCDAEDVIQKIFGVEKKLIDSVDEAEPIVAMLENSVPGWERMNPAEQSKIVHACNTFKERGMKASEIVGAISKMFPGTAPVTYPISRILYMLTIAATTIGSFVGNRRARKANAEKEVLERGSVAIMNAIDPIDKIGATIEPHMDKAGTDAVKVMQDLYQANVAK